VSSPEFVLHELPSGAGLRHADAAPQPIASVTCEDSFIILVSADQTSRRLTFVVAETGGLCSTRALSTPGRRASGARVMEWSAEEFELFIGLF